MVEPYRLQYIVVSSVWAQMSVALSSAVAIKELIGGAQLALGQRSNQLVSGCHHTQGTIFGARSVDRTMVSIR
jgi:hypothetical protein